MSQKQQKTFHLKVAHITPPQEENFTTLVNGAWQKLTTAKQRSYRVNKDSDQYKVLNDLKDMDISDKSKVISCPLFAFTLDANQNAAEISSDAKTYPITVLAPQRDAAKRLEFIEGLVWMCATKNYVAFMANKMITHNVLEEYFSWLFSKLTGKTIAVTFSDPNKPKLKNYNMTNVTRLTLAPPINLEGSNNKPKNDEEKHCFKFGKRTYDMVQTLLAACGAQMPDLSADGPNDFAQLDLSVILRVIRRNDYANSAAVVRKIAEAFRDVENPPVKFKFADGRTLDLKELRISRVMSISCINGIPDVKETQQALYRWLMEQIKQLDNPKKRTWTTQEKEQ